MKTCYNFKFRTAYRKLLLLLVLGILTSGISAQKISVSGTVKDDKAGVSMPGVTVMEKGTTNGVLTDNLGKFTISVLKSATLSFTYVGYASQEVQINGKTNLTIMLQEKAQSLNEVIVVGYSSQKKVDVTGAISVVEMKKIATQSLSSGNVMQALQGNIPGLYIEKSGNPSGASASVLIRGVNTLGDTHPLYIIDGVPTTRPEVFASLNPSTIESIQVLKDASASSIYGSRAANGVIIVTTKTSSKGGAKFNITYNTNVSILSEKSERYKMLSSLERGKVLWQASVNDHTDPTAGYGDIYTFNWNHDYNNPILTSVTVNPYVGGDKNMPAGNTDWQAATYKTGYVTNNDFTVSGGSDDAFVLANFGYIKNTGILKYTNYDRYSGKLNANFKLFNGRLKLGVNSQFSNSNETNACQDIGSAWTPGLAIGLAPTIPLYGLNGIYGGPEGGGYSDRNNPVLMQYANRWDNTANTGIFGNAYGELKIIDNLVFRSSVGLDYNAYNQKNIEPTISNGSVNRTDNSLTISTTNYSSLTFTNTLSYNFKLGKSKFEILAGTEAINTTSNSVISTAHGFSVETEAYFVLGAASGQRTTDGSATGSSLLSQFGKIGYNFNDKYLASVTVRRDGSSRFGTNNQYGIFPAATLGWKINNESFMKDISEISNLKLRVGYGEVGNQSIGDVAHYGLFQSRYGPTSNTYIPDFFGQYYNIGTAYDINGANTGTLPSGFVSIQAANASLKWETTKETNLGVDFGFFNNKLIGSFDYFTRTTDNILIQPPVASAVGEGQLQWVNGATKDNRGWEFSLAYSDKLENGLSYGISTNFGASKDKITKLPEEVRSAYAGNAEQSILGHSQYAIFGYIVDGIFQNQAQVDAAPKQVGAGVGRLIYKDLNKDGVIDSKDQEFFGTTLPKLEYGVRINLAYKNFDLAIFGSGVAGRIGQDPYIGDDLFVQSRDNAGPGTLNAWTPTNSGSSIPAVTLSNNNNEQRVSNYMFRNNSYFKIRNLQFGYSLPAQIIKKLGMSQLRVYFQGENLFWFTPKGYIGSDPERTNTSQIPVPTTYSFGVSVNF
jgi:TonB-linked SusC/RagA family outer membrane protein